MVEGQGGKSDFEVLKEMGYDDDDIFEILDGPGGLEAYLAELERQKTAENGAPKTRRELEEWEDANDLS